MFFDQRRCLVDKMSSHEKVAPQLYKELSKVFKLGKHVY